MTTPLTPEREAKFRVDELMAKCRRRGSASLVDVEWMKNEVYDLASELDRLRARNAQLDTALAATGRSLSSSIFDSDDPGSDALGAQWLYGQAMPTADDPFQQPRAFRSSVFSEAAKAAEGLDDADGARSKDYRIGYSDGVLNVAERLEKLADEAAAGTEATS